MIVLQSVEVALYLLDHHGQVVNPVKLLIL